ncbi:hypothetical protein KL941_002957 [Ogataea angusta]|nr:hypothetical protein KL941_002957 [Ogataea angusta]
MRICSVPTPDSTIQPTAQRRVARLGPREPLLPLARQHKGSLARYCGRQRHADLDTAVSNLLIQGHSLPLCQELRGVRFARQRPAHREHRQVHSGRSLLPLYGVSGRRAGKQFFARSSSGGTRTKRWATTAGRCCTSAYKRVLKLLENQSRQEELSCLPLLSMADSPRRRQSDELLREKQVHVAA